MKNLKTTLLTLFLLQSMPCILFAYTCPQPGTTLTSEGWEISKNYTLYKNGVGFDGTLLCYYRSSLDGNEMRIMNPTVPKNIKCTVNDKNISFNCHPEMQKRQK